MFEVWHRVVPTFREDPNITSIFPEQFELVATVDTAELGAVFQLTNHIDHDWRTNLGVTALPGRHRSTSVGDVIVASKGNFYEIASMGFNSF